MRYSIHKMKFVKLFFKSILLIIFGFFVGASIEFLVGLFVKNFYFSGLSIFNAFDLIKFIIVCYLIGFIAAFAFKIFLKRLGLIVMNAIPTLAKFPILKKVIPKSAIIILKILKKNKGYFLINNFFLYLNIDEPIDREIIIFKEYEPLEIRILSNLISKFNTSNFIDIGANCGFYTFYLANKFSFLKTLAFEPNHDAFEKLSYSLKKNSKNSQIFNFGLSDKNSVLKMRSLKKRGYVQSGGATIHNRNNIYNNEVLYDAHFKVGDEIIKIKNKNIAIKIDVEGHEINVLKGIKNILIENNCIIQIEIFVDNWDVVSNYLKSLNYNLIDQVQNRSNYFFSKNNQ